MPRALTTLRTLWPALLAPLPLLLGACAPAASLFSSDPGPMHAGPLAIGQVWTVTGVVDGRTVTARVDVPDLVLVPEGVGSVDARTQDAALSRGQAGFNVVDYDENVRVLRLRWIDDSARTYTCRIESPLGSVLRGVLTQQSDANNQVRGTCEARVSQQAQPKK